MSGKVRVGLDFDGTLTKFPPIIGFICSIFNTTTTPKFLYTPWVKFVLKLPIFLDHKKLGALKYLKKEYDFYLITGRVDSTRLIEELFLPWDYDIHFCEIVSPKNTKLTVEEFKEKLCKAFQIEVYFDDNRYTIYYLQKKGIKACLT